MDVCKGDFAIGEFGHVHGRHGTVAVGRAVVGWVMILMCRIAKRLR